jgi:hypothetical protein
MTESTLLAAVRAAAADPVPVADAPAGSQPQENLMADKPTAPAAPPAIATAAELTATYPTLAAELRTEGAVAERTRILGIDALGVHGHAELLAGLKADGKTSPAEAALAVLGAEKATRSQQLAAIAGVEKDTGKVAAAPTAGLDAPAPDAGTPEAWKAQYAKDAKLQAEFGSEGAYLAYQQGIASGRVKVLSQRSA